MASTGTSLDAYTRCKALKPSRTKELLVEYVAVRDKYGVQHRRSIRLRNQIVAGNVRLVIAWAKRRRGPMDLEDSVAYGNMGLIKAVERFDLSHNTTFSTYACWWVRHEIGRALMDHSRTVRVPVHMQDKQRVEARAARDGLTASGHESCIKDGVILIGKPMSLDAPIDPSDGERDHYDVFAADVEPADDELQKLRESQDIRKLVLETLAPKERDIIERRFGLRDDSSETLEEIGDNYGLSRERIRQLESSALKKLKWAMSERALGESAKEAAALDRAQQRARANAAYAATKERRSRVAAE